uniref:Uncharacterized protein n=1 Tax=Dunaliella tertiolecta TaxID=3047 RepID=A0A7S3QQA9_DUNTE
MSTWCSLFSCMKPTRHEDKVGLLKSVLSLCMQTTKLIASSAQLGGVSTQMTTSTATAGAAKAMGNSTKAMSAMHKAMKPRDVQKQMHRFAAENAKMEMTSEMMGDTMDDILDDEETEGESSDLVNQVLDDLGVEALASAATAPRSKAKAPQQAQSKEEEDAEDAEAEALAQRLANLKS